MLTFLLRCITQCIILLDIMTIAEMKTAAIAAVEADKHRIHGSYKIAGDNYSFEVYVVRVDRWTKTHYRCTYYLHGKRTSEKTFTVAFDAYKTAGMIA